MVDNPQGKERLPGKEPASGWLAGPYGHPFHPILVTVPLGAWIASGVFDVISRFADDPSAFVVGSKWLIAIGVVGALAAASVGFLDLVGIPTGTRAFRVGLVHMTLNLTVTSAYVVNFLWRRSGDGYAAGVSSGQLVLSAVSLVLLAASGYLGGMLAFRYGVRVADEETQADGFRQTGNQSRETALKDTATPPASIGD